MISTMKFKLFPSSTVMRFSLIATIVTIALSLLSMGFLGIGLFYIASALLTPLFPKLPTDIDSWPSDFAWPAVIAMPMLWSIGFLMAGWVYLRLQKLDWTGLTLKTSYIVILLFWNFLIWLLILMSITLETS